MFSTRCKESQEFCIKDCLKDKLERLINYNKSLEGLVQSKQKIVTMRWNNKIMSNHPDQNNSRLSSRSLSKFKKFNLQKSQAQISSNDHLEKFQLKLTSVQKIRHSNLNRSYISNYINPTDLNGNTSLFPMSVNVEKSDYELPNLNQQINKNILASKSQKKIQPQVESGKIKKARGLLEGFALFRKDTLKSQDDSNRKQYQPYTSNECNLTSQQRLKNILQKLRFLFLEFREVSQDIKEELKQSASISFQKVQSSLAAYVKQFQANFKRGINQLISITKKQEASSAIQLEKIQKECQVLIPSSENESSYRIKNSDNQKMPEQEVAIQTPGKNRPNSFKNKFKQIIDDTDQNMVIQNPVDKDKRKRNLESRQKSVNKISRKRTQPAPKGNSILDDSSFVNQNSLNHSQNSSSNSIKFCRINQRSATKQVKKLQEKITMIKNIFKSSTTPNQTEKLNKPPHLIQYS